MLLVIMLLLSGLLQAWLLMLLHVVKVVWKKFCVLD